MEGGGLRVEGLWTLGTSGMRVEDSGSEQHFSRSPYFAVLFWGELSFSFECFVVQIPLCFAPNGQLLECSWYKYLRVDFTVQSELGRAARARPPSPPRPLALFCSVQISPKSQLCTRNTPKVDHLKRNEMEFVPRNTENKSSTCAHAIATSAARPVLRCFGFRVSGFGF